MKPQQIAVLVVVATLGLLVLLLVLYGRPRKTLQEGTPINFQKGDPDSVLEGPRLHKALVWGLVSSIVLALFLTVYFLAEPFREASYGKKFLAASVTRGEHEFKPENPLGGANCAGCHGPEGEGGFASTDPTWPAPPLANVFARYTRDEITQIVTMGRPGTPMPSWGIEFGGPLNDQKIEDIVNFVETLQVPEGEHWELAKNITDGRQVYEQKCAVCHADDARGQGLGQPLPTFFAPDLTTEFYRLGLKVLRTELTIELRNAKLGAREDRTEPTDEEIAAAIASKSQEEIMAAGEEASRNTIENGRTNTPMPPWENRLRPEHIDAVVAYLKSIQRVPS